MRDKQNRPRKDGRFFFFFLQGLFRRQDLWRRFKRHIAVTFSPFWGMWLLTFWLNVSQMNLGWGALTPWHQKKSAIRQSGNHVTDAFADHFLYSLIHSLVYEAKIVKKNAALISRSILWLSEMNQPPAILINSESVWVIFKDLSFLNVNMFWLLAPLWLWTEYLWRHLGLQAALIHIFHRFLTFCRPNNESINRDNEKQSLVAAQILT